jgi:hypothetical protein
MRGKNSMDNFINLNTINLKSHPKLDEAWVQEVIAQNPEILGLGEVILKDKERIQPRAGRLDILLQDVDTFKRYEVEIQLGKLDESHIIRTIEYWDIERRKYPQYEHCAVIVAEDITSRFLNIIQLFNGHIPLIAIQMKAIEVDGKIGLIFTKVIDELQLGLVDDDEEGIQYTDRNYWLEKSSKGTMNILDEVFELIKAKYSDTSMKYNKHYIGLTESGRAKNFIIFRAKRNVLRFELRLNKDKELEERLNDTELEVLDYNNRDRRYVIRLAKGDVQKNIEVLNELIDLTYSQWG